MAAMSMTAQVEALLPVTSDAIPATMPPMIPPKSNRMEK